MKRKAFTCGACFKGFDVAEQAEAHWLAEHEPRTCPVCRLLLDDGYCHECEQDIAKIGGGLRTVQVREFDGEGEERWRTETRQAGGEQ